METCPHCHFLMRDDAVECGVCHRPRIIVARDNVAIVDDARVRAGHSTGVPVAIIVMLVLVLAACVCVSSHSYPATVGLMAEDRRDVGLLAVTQHWI